MQGGFTSAYDDKVSYQFKRSTPRPIHVAFGDQIDLFLSFALRGTIKQAIMILSSGAKYHKCCCRLWNYGKIKYRANSTKTLRMCIKNRNNNKATEH